MSAHLDAVLDLVKLGPIWWQTPQKTGYKGTHGSRDATTNHETITGWVTQHPEGVPALMTGAASGVVALDIDVRDDRNGFDSLEIDFDISTHWTTPTAISPSGGSAVLFRYPGRFIKTCTIAPGLETKGDRGWISLPPAKNRQWDPHLTLSIPVAPMPAFMERKMTDEERRKRYGMAALERAVHAIVEARPGSQRSTLVSECFSVGRLVGGGILSRPLAIEALQMAGRRMPSYDAHRPWNPEKVRKDVIDAVDAGRQRPRGMP